MAYLVNNKFWENLISCLSTENIRVDCNDMEKFLQICIKTLDELARQKKKYSRGNNMPFINKTIKKALMKRSHLREICISKTVQITANVNIIKKLLRISFTKNKT